MMIIRQKRNFLMVLTLALIFALVSCASVEKRYRKGQEMESKGRLEEAAQRYIRVLNKDPSMQDARMRLEDVGAQLIDTYLEQASAYESTGAYENAVAALNRIDSLRRRTSQVGVILQVPDGYEDFRQEMIDAAIASLFEQGEANEQAGNWAEALRRYERLRAYPLSPEQAQKADEARAGVHIKWAEQDLGRAYFRAAYGRAQKALDILGPDSETGSRALQLQKAALEAGTRTVAVLPFWASIGAAEEAPRGMESDLYDTLLYEYLSNPVLFVAPVDPGAIHREMSRLRIRSGEITRQTASMVGLTLNTDFVVIGWIESYSFEEGIPEEIERQVPLRRDRSRRVTYIERKFAVEMTAEVVYQVIDPTASRVLGDETVVAKVSGQFRQGYYDGDYTTLDLSREERMLFNKEAWLQAEEEMETLLYNKLAERIAASIFNRVLQFIR
jgi:tetratricopeptide (TPR) repeat protein